LNKAYVSLDSFYFLLKNRKVILYFVFGEIMHSKFVPPLDLENQFGIDVGLLFKGSASDLE